MKFLLIVFIALCSCAYSQKPQKQHFEVFSNDTSLTSRCTKAVNKMFLDSLRFLDSRRIIEFSNVQAKVVLYSAEELLKKHGKKISRYTIKEADKARKIKFEIHKTSIKIVSE